MEKSAIVLRNSAVSFNALGFACRTASSGMFLLQTILSVCLYRLADLLSRTVWLVLLAGGLYLLGRYSTRTIAMLRSLNPFLLMFAVLATLSIVWTIDRDFTIRRVIRLYTILMVCTGFTLVGWHHQRFQNALRALFTGLLAASFVFVYTSPEIAIHHNADHPELLNAWHGITTGKNILGSLASTGFLLWLHAWLSNDSAKAKSLYRL